MIGLIVDVVYIAFLSEFFENLNFLIFAVFVFIASVVSGGLRSTLEDVEINDVVGKKISDLRAVWMHNFSIKFAKFIFQFAIPAIVAAFVFVVIGDSMEIAQYGVIEVIEKIISFNINFQNPIEFEKVPNI